MAAAAALLALSLASSAALVRILASLPLLFVTWFFRDPERVAPAGEDMVLSPADGEVIEVCETDEEVVGPCTKVAVFMSLFSVHVNRSPVTGTVRDVRYRPGRFVVASLGRKTEDNERMVIYIDTAHGTFRVDQVAGLVARRIVCWLSPGGKVAAGERFGLIRFGSLLECWMPKGYGALCERGDKVRAGESLIGRRCS